MGSLTDRFRALIVLVGLLLIFFSLTSSLLEMLKLLSVADCFTAILGRATCIWLDRWGVALSETVVLIVTDFCFNLFRVPVMFPSTWTGSPLALRNLSTRFYCFLVQDKSKLDFARSSLADLRGIRFRDSYRDPTIPYSFWLAACIAFTELSYAV